MALSHLQIKTNPQSSWNMLTKILTRFKISVNAFILFVWVQRHRMLSKSIQGIRELVNNLIKEQKGRLN